MNLDISKSNRSDKKLKAVIDGNKTVHFGQAGASDFTKHKDEERTYRYIKRHSNTYHSKSNIASPAWMSRFILWGKSQRLNVQLTMLARSTRMSILN